MNIAYLELRLSGGASNSDPDASLGGIMSSTIIRSKTGTGVSNITGVTVDDAPGSADGAGTLAFTASTKSLTWTPYNGTIGAAIALTADGKYAIPGSAGYLFVTVDYSELPVGNQSDTVTVAQIANNLFDDISKLESYNGDTEYRCFYAVNTHPTDPFIGVKVYVSGQPEGADDIDIGLDAAGTGDGFTTGVATTVVNENTAPGSVTFSRPSAIGSALNLGILNAGQSRAMWQRRVVPAQTYTSTPIDIASLTFNAGY